MISCKLDPELKLSWSGNSITINGPKGTLIKNKTDMELHTEDGMLHLWSTTNSCLENAYFSWLQQLFIGVTKGYKQKLKLMGVGYRATVTDNELTLKLGYSHEVKYKIPSDIIITPSKNKGVLLLIQGTELDRVQQVAVEIRRFREPDAYKGKGVHYYGEVLRLKKGKREGK